LRPKVNRSGRLLDAIPIIAERKERMWARAGMGEVLILPADFAEARRSAMEELARAQDTEAEGREKVSAMQRSLDDLVVPDPLLAQEDVITDLHKQLGSHLKAMRDLPTLEGEAVQLQEDAETILKTLRPGLPLDEVESLRLSSIEREKIRDLVTSHSGLVEKQQTAKRAINTIQDKKGRVKAELDALPAVRAAHDLRDLIRRIQKQGDLEKALAQAKTGLRAEEDRAGLDLRQLPLWSGTLEFLEALAVPGGETIERFGNELGEIHTRLKDVATRISDVEKQSAADQTELNALRGAGAVPSEEYLFEARKHRDRGWKLVRAAWREGREDADELMEYDHELPLDEAYERSVLGTDEVSDRLRREAERVVRNAKLEAEIAGHRGKLTVLRAERDALNEGRAQLEAEWTELWRQINVEALSPAEMGSWIGRQQKLVEQAEKVRGCRKVVAGIQEQIDTFRVELVAKLASLGDVPSEGATFGDLLGRAETLADEVDGVETLRKELKKTLSSLIPDQDRARLDEAEASENLRAWETQWSEALARVALEGAVTPTAANAILERIQELFDKIKELEKLRKRIKGIERDNADFVTRTSDLVGRLMPDLAGVPAAEAAAVLNVRLTEGRRKAVTREQLKKQLKDEQEQLKKAERVIEERTRELSEMCRQARAETPEQLEEIEKRSQEAAALDEEIRQLERQLLPHSGGGSVDDLVREAEGVDADALPSEIQELAQKISELEKEQGDIGETIGNEKNELKRMNGESRAADSAEKAHSTLAEIREAAERYVRLRLASAILHAEIERYRLRNQGPILKRASEIFSRLSLESFSGLTTNYTDDDTPVLMGIRPTGEEVGVGGMSDGTCDQLYLSLRLASLEKYLRENQPLPFIIDDLLINFDDQRAEAALKVLSELSSKTQVIFFTHHRHLVDMATKAAGANETFVHSI